MRLRNRKGQVTGEVKDGVYEQKLKRRAHAFHSRGELAIDTQHLKTLKSLNVTMVRKIFKDTGETFEATIEKIERHGYEKQWSEDDGPQTFMNEKHWTYRNENQYSMM